MFERRMLPSLGALRALEALDRLGSATAVAEELSLTQSAVSRQLQTLEQQLGAVLIIREKRRMRLTPAAKTYAAEVREALNRIAQASIKLRVNPEGGQINLAILPTFGMRWLVPRLPEFATRHPDITVNMATRLHRFNFGSEDIDAAIHYGKPDWPDTQHLRLKPETVVPVCAPSLLQRHTVARPADILSLPLMHIQTRPKAWSDWFAHWGVDAPTPQGMLHDQFSTITQAAIHGLGVALLPDYLAQQDITSGRLVPVWGGTTPSMGSYYLVWPKEKATDPALRKFRDWLATQAEEEDELPR